MHPRLAVLGCVYNFADLSVQVDQGILYCMPEAESRLSNDGDCMCWAMQALRLWAKPAPSSLYAFAAGLQPEGLPFCCKAVHLEPWHQAHQHLLRTMSA